VAFGRAIVGATAGPPGRPADVGVADANRMVGAGANVGDPTGRKGTVGAGGRGGPPVGGLGGPPVGDGGITVEV
jgi:hypothetical protein